MSVVQLKSVTKRFGSFAAVSEATFNLNKGEILSLLGPSGCGKTTTLRMIAGFEEPSEGDVLIAGASMRNKRPYERNVGLLFQDYALFPHLSVKQNVAYGLKRRNYDRSQIDHRVGEMLDLVKLDGFEQRRPSQLSGGQQQRVALARALATNPEVVLLDEPLSALDAKLRQELRIELKQILTTVGASTIIVTHDQEEAMSLGDRLIVMSEGRIVQQGPPTEVYKNPQTKFVAEFIGRSNWLRGVLGPADRNNLCTFEVAEGLTLSVPKPEFDAPTYEVCIRPERIRVGNAATTGGATNVNELNGTVQHVAHLGADIHIVMELASGHRITISEQFIGQSMDQYQGSLECSFFPSDCIVVAADS